MPVAGQIDTAELSLDVFGPDTVAVLAVTNPAGATSSPTATATDSTRQTWRARVPYPGPGLYRHVWSVTGTGEGVYQPLTVAVGPSVVDDPRHTYATTADLAKVLHEAPPVDAEVRLRRASAVVDDALFCAVYAVDSDKMPTDPDVAAALNLATCEVVAWWASTGDDGSGAMSSVQSASIAGVSLGYAGGGGSKGSLSARARASLLGPAALRVLEDAGLIQGPWY